MSLGAWQSAVVSYEVHIVLSIYMPMQNSICRGGKNHHYVFETCVVIITSFRVVNSFQEASTQSVAMNARYYSDNKFAFLNTSAPPTITDQTGHLNGSAVVPVNLKPSNPPFSTSTHVAAPRSSAMLWPREL